MIASVYSVFSYVHTKPLSPSLLPSYVRMKGPFVSCQSQEGKTQGHGLIWPGDFTGDF